ncbi:hypothetical protein LP785_15930, partial [Escherichia coli]|nr:hypothetical protein [Escherichia coli]
EKRVFLVILFTSFSGSLVSRIPGAVHSLTLTMAPAFKDEGELTDMTDITGNLTVLVEAK